MAQPCWIQRLKVHTGYEQYFVVTGMSYSSSSVKCTQIVMDAAAH